MRRILLLFFIILLLPLSARAEYFLRGRVVNIDRQKGEIILFSLACGECGGGVPPARGTDPDTSAQPKEPKDNKIFIISADFIPPCVMPDHIIQVWGEQSKGNPQYIQASRITGPGWRHGKDSTGVRSRLRKRCFVEPRPPGVGDQ